MGHPCYHLPIWSFYVHWPLSITSFFFFSNSFAGTWEASDSVSGSGKNSGWKHNSSGTRANPSQFCSNPFHGPSSGSNSAININSTQVGWWDPHGYKFQLPPYDRRYPCLHWCIKVWGNQELSAAGCRIPSQAPHWSISNDRASWSCEFGSYPKVLSQLLALGSFFIYLLFWVKPCVSLDDSLWV